MGIREKLAKHSRIVIPVTFVAILLAIGFTIYNSPSLADKPYLLNTYYSADDGASYFAGQSSAAAEMARRTPPAYRTFIYSAGGKPFVAYLIRTPLQAIDDLDATTAAIAEEQKKLATQDPKYAEKFNQLAMKLQAKQNSVSDAAEVKRPGSSNRWVLAKSAEGSDVMNNIKSPGGETGMLQPILP